MKVIKVFLFMVVVLVAGVLFNNAFAENPLAVEKLIPDEVVLVQKELKKNEIHKPELYEDSTKDHGLDLDKISYMQQQLRLKGVSNSPFTKLEGVRVSLSTEGLKEFLTQKEGLLKKYMVTERARDYFKKEAAENTKKMNAKGKEKASMAERRKLKKELAGINDNIASLEERLNEENTALEKGSDAKTVILSLNLYNMVEDVSRLFGITYEQVLMIPLKTSVVARTIDKDTGKMKKESPEEKDEEMKENMGNISEEEIAEEAKEAEKMGANPLMEEDAEEGKITKKEKKKKKNKKKSKKTNEPLKDIPINQ